MSVSITDLGHTSNSSTGTVVLTVTGSPAAGDTVVVLAAEQSATQGSVSDSAGNTYTSRTNVSSGTVTGGLFSSVLSTGLTSGSSTITFTKVGTGRASMTAVSLNGASAIDTSTTNTNSGSSSTPTVTSGSPTNSGEFFLAGVAQASNKTFTQDAAWSTPFTSEIVQTVSGVAGGNKQSSGSGALTYSPTLSASAAWSAHIIAFPAASVGGTPTYAQNSPMLGM